MKYYRAIEDIILADGGIIPKGSVTSEITYDGKSPEIQALFEDDVETTEELQEETPPTSPPEPEPDPEVEGGVWYNPPPKQYDLPYKDDTEY
jgi:hypothetical protein